ncbi:MAG: hypothetical protein HY092_00170, partial [Candidatus Kerfeldbacteria bacterium]|nr:hypothetical protein [Candidatus Kerfeldbacteria bacterium]
GQPALSPVAIFSQLGSLYTLAILLYLMFKVDWTKTMHRWLDHPALRRHKPEVL